MAQSEVAQLKQRIVEEYLAAKHGFTGLAFGTSRHAFITARLENMERCRQQLNALVGEQEGAKLVAETLVDL